MDEEMRIETDVCSLTRERKGKGKKVRFFCRAEQTKFRDWVRKR